MHKLYLFYSFQKINVFYLENCACTQAARKRGLNQTAKVEEDRRWDEKKAPSSEIYKEKKYNKNTLGTTQKHTPNKWRNCFTIIRLTWTFLVCSDRLRPQRFNFQALNYCVQHCARGNGEKSDIFCFLSLFIFYLFKSTKSFYFMNVCAKTQNFTLTWVHTSTKR